MVWAKTWPMPPVASTTARPCTAPTPSRCPSPMTCSVTPATPPSHAEQQVEDERVLDDLDPGIGRDGRDQCALDLGTGGVAAGVRDPVAVVAALAGQRQLPGRGVVELRAERDQLAHRLGTLGDQHAYRVEVAGPGTRDQGVVLVLLRGVARAQCGRDPALRPLGRAGVEDVLGDDQHRAAGLLELGADPQGRGEAGDAGADDDHVGARRPARGGRAQPAGDVGGRAAGHPGRLARRRRGPGPSPATASAGSKPVARILLSASTKTTCGRQRLRLRGRPSARSR